VSIGRGRVRRGELLLPSEGHALQSDCGKEESQKACSESEKACPRCLRFL
jgi:hypothetical protein